MTSHLIDINVWLALTWAGHPHAGRAGAWLESLPKNRTRLLFCRITQLGLMRLLTNKGVMGESTLTVAEAVAIIDRWNEDPRIGFAAEGPGIEAAFRRCLSAVAGTTATKAIMDAYLAAFAETEKATLVTFDKALSKAARQRNAPSLLLTAR